MQQSSPWKQNIAEATTDTWSRPIREKTGKTTQEYSSQGSFNKKYSFPFFTYYNPYAEMNL